MVEDKILDLTQFINIFFSQKEKYNTISIKTKIAYAFILNRRFSKKYPLIADKIMVKGSSPNVCVDFWFLFFKHETKVPNWFWDKKQIKNEKDKIISTLGINNLEYNILEKIDPETLSKLK